MQLEADLRFIRLSRGRGRNGCYSNLDVIADGDNIVVIIGRLKRNPNVIGAFLKQLHLKLERLYEERCKEERCYPTASHINFVVRAKLERGVCTVAVIRLDLNYVL